MRVLMQNRVDVFTNIGGDTIQMMKTKEALEALGVQVHVSLELEPDVSGYDVVHLFNLVRVHETYHQLQNAKRQSKPVALSTIYWDFAEFEALAHGGVRKMVGRLPEPIREAIKAFGRILRRRDYVRANLPVIFGGYRSMQRDICRSADVLLPNSMTEKALLERKWSIPPEKFVIVPNAVDEVFFSGKGELFQGNLRNRKFVLCVGRFDPRKNQLALAHALRDSDIPMVFIGHPAPNYHWYYNKVKRTAPPNALFLSHIRHRELPHAYAAATVHVLPSWLETPGLASLEAAAAGCQIVVTDRGSTREYFSSHAWYCEPNDPISIRRAVIQAFQTTKADELRRIVAKQFTWKEAAGATLGAYEKVVRTVRT